MTRTLRAPGALAAVAVLAAGCTTVTIDEADAFDRKRTVSVADLEARGMRVIDARLDVGDGVHIDTRRVEVPDPRGTVLLFGGNGFLMVTAHDTLETFLGLKLSVVMFDYRGYGQSGGEPTVAALKTDALRVYDWTTARVPADRLILHGHSLGSLVATWVASQRPSAGLVLESPLTNVADLLDRMTPWLIDIFVGFDIHAALAAEHNGPRITRVKAPILLMVGDADPVTPPSMAEDLHALTPANSRLVIIEGGGHNDLPPTAAYRQAYGKFLDQALAETTAALENPAR